MPSPSLRPGSPFMLCIGGVASLLVAVTIGCGSGDPTSSSVPDDCWGGALSADPVHCHAINEAHKEETIEVEGIFDDGAGTLYLFFNYLRPVTEDGWLYGDLAAILQQKGVEYVRNQGARGV